MSEANKSLSSSFWGFVTSTVETVKQKSEEIVNIYKEDLSEFSKTIVQDTQTVLQEKLADLQIGDAQKVRSRRSKNSLNSHEARIALLQKDLHTYTDAPEHPSFEEWASAFNIGAHTETITHLLTSNESVREFHTRLVPAQVSYRDFWCRYYYRVHKLEEEEQRRAALLKSATESNEDEDFNWDDEDDNKKNDREERESEKETTSPKKPNDDVIDSDNVTKQQTESTDDENITDSPANTNTPTDTIAAPSTPTTAFDTPLPSSPAPTTPSSHSVPPLSIPSPSTPPSQPEKDEIDVEIEQKYLQIQNSPTESKKLENGGDEDAWGGWE